MSENREKTEGLAYGRIFASLAKKDPVLYEKIKKHMDVYGIRASDLIIEALRTYTDFTEFSSVDTRSLFASLKLLEKIGEWLFITMANYMKLMSSIMYAPAEEESEEKGEEKKKGEKVSAELKTKMVEMMTPLLSTVMSSIVSVMSNMIAQYTSKQQPQQVKIPVKDIGAMPRIELGKPAKESEEKEEEAAQTVTT
ncbi:MAG: hypothetical protein QXV82_08905 [Ignisphaera sp.]